MGKPSTEQQKRRMYPAFRQTPCCRASPPPNCRERNGSCRKIVHPMAEVYKTALWSHASVSLTPHLCTATRSVREWLRTRRRWRGIQGKICKAADRAVQVDVWHGVAHRESFESMTAAVPIGPPSRSESRSSGCPIIRCVLPLPPSPSRHGGVGFADIERA